MAGRGTFLLRNYGWVGTILLLGLAFGLPAMAQSGAVESRHLDSIQLGLDGKFKVGYWSPLRLTISGGSNGFQGHVRVTGPDGDGVPTRFRAAANSQITVEPNETWAGWRYFKLGRTQGRVRVELVQPDGKVVESRSIQQPAVHPTSDFWVVGTGAEIGLEQASGFLVRAQATRIMRSELTEPDQFPDRWYGYEGVDVILVATGTTNPIEQLDDRQFQALRRWLELGGRMLLSVGGRAAELFHPEQRFAAFRPGEFEELSHRWKASGLEHYASAGQQLINRDAAPLATFSQLRGEIVCLEGAGGGRDRELVTRYSFGLGQITYLALDLDQPPMTDWPDRPRLVARLLQDGKEMGNSGRSQDGLGRVTHIGFKDLSGQLRAALDQFAGVVQVRFSWIAGILVIYVLLLGPIDFFGLHHLGRYRWTWITFPVVVLAFGALAVFLSDRWQGNAAAVNQVDIVDVDLDRSLVRGTTWANLYAPKAAALDLDLQPTTGFLSSAQPRGVLVSWQGLPGDGLGGMNTTASVGELTGAYTIFTDEEEIRGQKQAIGGLPIHTSSTKPVVARWRMRFESPQQERLGVKDGGLLDGRVVNPLDIPLSHCSVFFENWFYRLDRRLLPGDGIELGQESPLDLKWQLTRRRLLDTTDVSTPWNQEEFDDMPRLIQMLMFHEAAGGRDYTRLDHRYQAFVDLSSLLHMGNAVLVGRSDQPVASLYRDGQLLQESDYDQRWTYFRIVIPVQQDP
jgi:hypothetical protein